MGKIEGGYFLPPVEPTQPVDGRARGVLGATMTGLGAQIAGNPGFVNKAIATGLVIAGITVCWSAGRDADLGRDYSGQLLQGIRRRMPHRNRSDIK